MRDIVAIGSIALDDVETPFGRREGTVGGSLVYFSYAASIFSKVSLVGVVGRDFPKEILNELKERGCSIEGIEVKDGKSFRWAGVYQKGREDPKTLKTELGLFGEFNPEPPKSFKRAKILYLGNLTPQLQGGLLKKIDADIVAMDTMNHWIQSSREELLKILPSIDVFFLNRQEAEMLTGESGSYPSCKRLLSMGPKTVVLKRGEAGAMMCNHNEVSIVPGYPIEKVVDPTGAGDSFAGGFLGYFASGGTMRRALATAIAVSSFSVESFSVERLREVKTSDVDRRLEKLKDILKFWGSKRSFLT